MKRIVPVFVAALASVLLPSAALATNGAKPIASGARAGGRGGVDIAVADDATALNTNPAGIGFIDGQRFDLNMGIFVPTLKWSNSADSTTSRRPRPGAIIAGPLFATVVDFDEPWKLGEALSFDDETYSELPPRTSPDYKGSGVKLGFGIFGLSGNFIDFDTRSPFYDDDPQHWQTELREVAAALAVAFRPLHWLSIGFSPAFIFAQLENDQPVTQPKSVLKGHPLGDSSSTGPTYADAAPFLGVSDIEGYGDIDDASTYGFRARIGALAIPFQWETGQLAFGLAYATQTFKQDFLGEVTVDFTRQINELDPDGTLLKPVIAANTGIPENEQQFIGKYNLRLGPLDLPQELSAGAALTVYAGGTTVLLAGDVTWLNWKRTFKKFDAKLTDGESRELNELTSDERGDSSIVAPLNWRDQVVLAGGITVSPADWIALRAGYNYGRNPVPKNTIQPTTPAIFEHHITAGVSFFFKCAELTFAVEHAVENSVVVGENIGNRDVEGSEISGSISSLAIGFALRF